LNQIRKPSTAGEITELLNRDLDLEERPFQARDVEEWLRNTEDTALTLYWSRARPGTIAVYSQHCQSTIDSLRVN
jgi:hypothetical protein